MPTDPSPSPADLFTEARLRGFEPAAPPASLDARMEVLLTETRLRRFELAAAPAALDARMEELLSAPAVAARLPQRSFWRKAAPWAAVAGLAACAALVMQMGSHASVQPPAARHNPEIASAVPAVTVEKAPVAPQVFEGAVPVGYQYQGSRTLYAQETPLGAVKSGSGQPQQAYQRRTLLRHTFEDPQTHATYEVDVPQNDLILENLQSY